MTKIRNKTIVAQVLARDIGICRCCGLEACEIHHIIPIIKGGEDNPKNMISLCSTCHSQAPDTKQEFYEYMKSGGARTYLTNGKIVDLAEQVELKSKGAIKFQEAFDIGRKIALYIKKSTVLWALEKYNMADINQVENIDFTENIIKDKQTTEANKGEVKEIV